MPHQVSEEMTGCIADCRDCQQACLEAVAHRLQKDGRHAAPGHVLLLLDCAEICGTAADFMSRGSRFHASVCLVCAEICDRCAEQCAALDDDETMRRCAEACSRCADSCRHMAAEAPAAR